MRDDSKTVVVVGIATFLSSFHRDMLRKSYNLSFPLNIACSILNKGGRHVM